MASSYSYPVNTDKVFYIEMQYGVYSFGDLFWKIQDHFGANVTLDQFRIEIDNLQVEGCGCCYDSGDWRRFLTVTLEEKPVSNTPAVLLSTLTEES